MIANDREAKMTEVIRAIPEEWRGDFALLLEGYPPSIEFQNYFERHSECRSGFDKALKILDEELIPLLRQAMPLR